MVQSGRSDGRDRTLLAFTLRNCVVQDWLTSSFLAAGGLPGVPLLLPRPRSVHLRFSFGGLLGGIIGGLFRSITERYLAQEATALKNKVEQLR